jgi:hypothetical protein
MPSLGNVSEYSAVNSSLAHRLACWTHVQMVIQLNNGSFRIILLLAAKNS